MSLTAQQIARRRDGIGASEVAAALGLSKWKTPLQLYLEKRGECPPIAQTTAMRFGHAAEPFILDEYELERGVRLVRAPDTITRGVMLCHLDAWVPGELVVNAKTARSREEWGEPGTDEVPKEYVVQEQAEMLLAGVKLAHVPVLFRGAEIETFEIPFDAELADMIDEGVAKFWERVLKGNAPDPTTPDDIRLRWPSSTSIAREATIEVVAAVDLLAQAKEAKKAAEAKEAEYAAVVQTFMEDAGVLTYDGQTLATWKQNKPGSKLDIDAMTAAHPAIVAHFTKPKVGARPLLVKKG